MHMASGGSSFNSAGLVKKPNMNSIELFITDVVSEGSFLKIWAQSDRMAAIFIDRIMFAHKNNFDKGIGSVQQINQLQIGLLCCAKYTDGNYYRCKILSFITHVEVNVIFVDYGYKAPIHISNIRLFDNLAQDKTYLEGHELSSEYYLAHGVPKTHQWDSEDVKIIKQRLCFKELKCLILEEMYGKKFVKIFINDIDFVQILKYNNLADEVLLDAQRVILRSKYSFDFPPPPFPHQKISSISTTHPSLTSQKISSVLTTEPAKKSSAPPFQSEMLAPGTKHQVYVSHVEDGPLSFSVQIKDVAEKSLVQMMAQINSTSNIKNLSGPWLPGVVCLGRFSEDQSLCRAIIMNIYDEKCLLYYVDYGNSEVLPHTEIFEIPLQFVDIKVVAMRFTLANIKDISFSDKVKAYFKEQVTFKLVVIEVTETESSPLKQYCEMFIDGENIKVKLLEKVRAEHPPAFIKQHLPITRTREDIVVTYVESPSCFYVQLNKNKEALSTVMGCVDIICKKGAAQLTKDKLQPGKVCCALYSADQVWYRAQILMVYEETASVLFVDYGNQDIVPLALLREIKSDLVEKVRTQAVECCLIGYHNILPDQAISMKLEELILEQTLTMEVLDYTNNHIPIVELYDVSLTKISSKLANTQAVQPTSAGHQQPHTFNISKDRDEWNDLPASSQPNLNNDSNPSSDGIKNKSKWSHDNEEWQDKGGKNLHREKDKTSWRNKENSNKLSKNFNTDGGWPEEDVGSSDSKPRKFDRYEGKKSFKFNSREGDNSSEGDKSDQFEDRGNKKFEYSSGRDYKRKGGDSGFGNDRGGEGGFRSNRGNGHFKRDSGFRNDRGDGSFKRDGFKNDRGDGSFKRDGFRNNRGGGNFKRDRGDSYQTEFSGNNKMSTWGEPKELTVPQSVVSVGFTGIVEIVYSISPSEFYVQLTSDVENLTALMSDIASSFATGGGEIIDNPKKGQFCIAKYSEDETWYRGCIETVNTASCDVIFIDYGNHEEVNNDNIKKMKESFTILPTQSVKCELYGCVSPSEGWSEEEVSNFIANCEGKTLSANFVEKVFSKNSFKVVLTDQETGVVINSATSLGYSVPEENVNAAIAKINEKTYCDFPIQLGSNLRVQPTWFISPSQFYVQPLNSESEYRKMIEQMQIIVKKGVIKPTTQLKVGDPIIAKFKEDNVLYRARVKSDGHSPTVTFVDYGNTAKVESGMIWELEPQYAILPVQAICCALSGIVPVDKTWSKAGTSNIISYFTGDEFNCTFVDQQNGIYTVNLFNGDKNVAQELIANGLAVEKSEKHSDKDEIEEVELVVLKGQTFSVVITQVENSKQFYIHLMPEQAIAWLQILQEDAKNLKALPMEQLNRGTVCIHKYDDYLNRCKIMDVENMRVFYIDSGLVKEVKSEDLFELPASKEHPALATPCELYLQEPLTEELEVQFKSTATYKPYFAYVHGVFNDKLQVTLYVKYGQPNQNLILPFKCPIICPMPILSSHHKVIVVSASGESVYLQKPELVDSLYEFLGKLFNFYDAQEYEEQKWETYMYCAAKKFS
uniref:Tudor domain-containing protein n=1 Tax=Clastoptera arizonana TaxID=38151 RepID=A0A1B6D169_9HEMI